jgi:hypothetical protein
MNQVAEKQNRKQKLKADEWRQSPNRDCGSGAIVTRGEGKGGVFGMVFEGGGFCGKDGFLRDFAGFPDFFGRFGPL